MAPEQPPDRSPLMIAALSVPEVHVRLPPGVSAPDGQPLFTSPYRPPDGQPLFTSPYRPPDPENWDPEDTTATTSRLAPTPQNPEL